MQPLRFFGFPNLEKAFFAIFQSSQCWDCHFFPSFVLPKFGKDVFHCFLVFSRRRNPFFAVFSSSYPYESIFFLFFVDCTPYLNRFSRKLMIYSRIRAGFREKQKNYSPSTQRAAISAQRSPSIPADTIPPAYPAPSPQGNSPCKRMCCNVSLSRIILTGLDVLVSAAIITASFVKKP